MKILAQFSCFAALALLGACASSGSQAAAAPDQEEMMAKWAEFATPGDAHKVLEPKIGRWTMVVRMFEPGTGTPTESTATSDMQWILDGRYVADHTEGPFMGQTFKGMGVTGFDNIKKKYVWTWIDNMGTGVMNGEGTWNAAKKTFEFTSQMPDVMTGKYVKGRSTERFIDNDHWVSEMYGPGPDGKEFKSMEIEYTRAK